MSDFCTSKTVKANKCHKCEHCRGMIKRGSFYIRISGVYEGDVFSIKAHPYCEEIRNRIIELFDIGPGDEMLELPDQIHESIYAKGMLEIAKDYNTHAASVDGVIVDLSDVERPNALADRAGGKDIENGK